MARVKRGKTARKKRKKILKCTKGFRWSRKSKYKAAKEALLHARSYSYRDRKTKKRNSRKLWQTQISAACKKNGLSYNRFIFLLKQKKINLDRKILSLLARERPDIFEKIKEEITEEK